MYLSRSVSATAHSLRLIGKVDAAPCVALTSILLLASICLVRKNVVAFGHRVATYPSDPFRQVRHGAHVADASALPRTRAPHQVGRSQPRAATPARTPRASARVVDACAPPRLLQRHQSRREAASWSGRVVPIVRSPPLRRYQPRRVTPASLVAGAEAWRCTNPGECRQRSEGNRPAQPARNRRFVRCLTKLIGAEGQALLVHPWLARSQQEKRTWTRYALGRRRRGAQSRYQHRRAHLFPTEDNVTNGSITAQTGRVRCRDLYSPFVRTATTGGADGVHQDSVSALARAIFQRNS